MNDRYALAPRPYCDPWACVGGACGVGIGMHGPASAWDYGPPQPTLPGSQYHYIGEGTGEILRQAQEEAEAREALKDLERWSAPELLVSPLGQTLGGAASIVAGAAMRKYIGGWLFGPLGWIWIGFGALATANGLVSIARRA